MILGTAGHIDHGKTTLVRALTGVDTDRLPEEKRRGITIDLGFAPLRLADGTVLGVVDVPGHEAFVRTMLAGATGVDLALLVVAADEGVMPQTREHLQILALLGVRSGVVAITKRDLVDDEWLALVDEDLRGLLEGTPLAGAPRIPVSATRGDGLEALRAALAAAAAAVPARDATDLFRLPVDRAFTVRGTGTVVTGTVWSGRLGRDANLRLFPGDRPVRVRSLQAHGAAVHQVGPGTRAAIALSGVELGDVARGAVLVAGPAWRETRILRANVAFLDETVDELDPRHRYRLHLGTQTVDARLVPARVRNGADSAPLPVRIHLDEPLVARAGDRFVLREASPARTIGGGEIVDPMPPGHRPAPWPPRAASRVERLRLALLEAGSRGIAAGELPVRFGVPPGEAHALADDPAAGAIRIGGRIFDVAAASAVSDALRTAVHSWLEERPLEPGAPLQEMRSRIGADDELLESALRALLSAGELEADGALVRPPGWKPVLSDRDREVMGGIERRLSTARLEPPSVTELVAAYGDKVPSLVRLLERGGRVVAVEPDRFFDASALEHLFTDLRARLAPDHIYAPAELREMLGVSRKYLIPLLEYCDRKGVTRRTETGRVRGA